MQKEYWTKEQTELLRKLYASCTCDELVILLHKSKKSIRAKASRYGLKKSVETLRLTREKNARNNYGRMQTEEAKKKKTESIRNMIRRERLRLKYGMKQRTKRILSSLTPHSSIKEARERYNIRQKGYIISNGSRTAYYMEEKERKKRFEKNYKKKGYTFKHISKKNEIIKAVDNEPLPFTIII